MTAFLISFAVIFVAELGDKSQLMALTFAARYPWLPVLIGITAAAAIMFAVSVFVGAVLGAVLPTTAITIVAALAFVGVGVWTLLDDSDDEPEPDQADRPTHHVALAVGSVFLLAELGDKTMLAAVTLATREGWFGTWLGATLGMVVADALAIALGRALGTRLPQRAVRIGAAIAFFVFAGLLLFEAARG